MLRPPSTGWGMRAWPREPRSTACSRHLVERLDAVGFFFPPEKRSSMTASLENLFRRAPLTDADVRTLHGVVRALAVKERRRR